MNHITDWFPGRISKEYKDNYDGIQWKDDNEDAEVKLPCPAEVLNV